MTTPTRYMLLFRGPNWDEGRTPDETRAIMDKVQAWFEDLQKRGIAAGAGALERTGRVVSRKNPELIADGPYAEAKEIVGGYLLLNVDDIDKATAIAEACPTLDHGIEIEVRPMLDECPIEKRLREREALATA